MALNVGLKIVHIAAALLSITVFSTNAQISKGSSTVSTCLIKNFNDTIMDAAKKDYGKCYVFSYNFSSSQVSGKKFLNQIYYYLLLK